MKSVAIIGAGPSGLVSAKICLLLYPGKFKVTIFEKQNRVGGLWAVDATDQHKTLNPQMPTNLSKYTVSFSDLSWDSVDLFSDENGQNECLPKVPTFPKAWMVGKYLQTYRERYIPSDVLRLNTQVTKVSPTKQNDQEEPSKWKVEWTNSSMGASTLNAEPNEEFFDCVIVAAGFLGNPIPGTAHLKQEEVLATQTAAKIIHSSRFRTLADLVPESWSGSGDFLVYGGSMSGVEVAASLAFQISDQKHSPSVESLGNPKVYHVTSRPFYVFTPFAAMDVSKRSPAYLPLDLVFFELSRRPVEAASATIGRMPADKAEQTHAFFRAQIGTDQGDVNASALYASATGESPYITNATGTSYLEFVRSGLIVPVTGRLESFDVSGLKSEQIEDLTAKIVSGNCRSDIKDIVGAVEATGYQTNLQFLSEDVKAQLDFDGNTNRLPVILNNAQTSNEKVSGLAFVGIHEGSYWGTEECQARVVVESWMNKTSDSSDKGKIEEDPSVLKDLRKGITEKSNDVPQLLYGDYVGQMEQSASKGYSSREDGRWDGRNGPAIPSRYLDSSSNLEEVELTMNELQRTIERASTQGLFVARAAFIGFQGTWTMTREIKSVLDSSPSGTFIGSAEFHPRSPTHDRYDSEYLYIENGQFNTDQGFSMKASRRYAYRYRQDNDQLSTWFVKFDGKTVDYLFLDLAIRNKSDKSHEDDYWTATGHHPCDPDTYDAKYTFQFRGMALEKFIVEYQVIGPRKNYTSTTIYKRPRSGQNLDPSRNHQLE